MSENTRDKEQWQLLHSLRSTVEGLLIDGVSNVWNVYGGLNRLHSVMERIFKHGCRIFDPDGEPDCWIFIQGLNWLQPSLATSPILSENEDYLCNLPARITSKKDMLWLYKSLEGHSLSHKLSWLLSDKEHLLSCLEPWAFLCQENLAEATLLYLRAVERNQPVLLAEIDPCLFLPSWISPKTSPRRHRRSSSYPVNFSGLSHILARDKSTSVLSRCQLDKLKASTQSVSRDTNDAEGQMSKSAQVNADGDAQGDNSKVDDVPLKTWNSLPALVKGGAVVENLISPAIQENGNCNNSNNRRRTVELAEIINVNYADSKQPVDLSVDKLTAKPKTPIRKTRSRTKAKHSRGKKAAENAENAASPRVREKVGNTVEETRPIAIAESAETRTLQDQWTQRKKTSFLVGSAPEFTGSWSSEVEGQKDIRTPRKSFMEDGGSSVQPMATGYFPRPAEGQSLTSFLSSARFSRAHDAELDRENAHFSVCEAMIAAIEQVKCNRLQRRLLDDAADDESDEEINRLKQRIRLRRRQRQEERCRGTGRRWSRGDLLSDGRTDTTTTTDQSVSPLSTSPGSSSEDSVSTEDSGLDDERRTLRNGGMSASTASLLSDAESRAARYATDSNVSESSVSAEGVALSLISRFSEKQLPRASELQWLVSEKDAPQRLLPMPKSWPVSPDEVEIEDARTIPLRGTVEWAPPRPQIIFTPHPPPVRRMLIAKQNYRCAGCGMKVAVKYANRFRYCEYLGRYFCTGCHTNQVAFVPGKILSKWDFNRYPVSNFSYRLLDQMMSDPLFQVNDLNPLLYRRIKQLDKTRLLRTKLFFLKDFLFACRFATSLQDVLKKEPNYIINDPHVYSIQDLINVKLGVLFVRLQELVQVCCAHIVDCELCQARGFVCELCCSKDVIFPWDLSKVIRCEKCGACFHIDCKQSSDKLECPRCMRLHARRISRDEKP